MIGFRNTLQACACAVVSALTFGGANAAIVTANTPDCFTGSSSNFAGCDDSAFLAAIGGGPTDVFLQFDTDKNGDLTPGGVVTVAGDIFSDDVTFSSRASATFGGSNSSDVQLINGGSTIALIGPVADAGGFLDGILDIIFSSGVSAVGFTIESFSTAESISVFDTSDVLLATFSGLTDGLDYIGIIATMGELIGRVSLEGDNFEIRNIQFNFADGEIPLPAGLLLFPAGLAALRLATRRRKAAA